MGGLGGVKDIDQDTKIIPETSPNADEDILYFSANNNTMRLSAGALTLILLTQLILLVKF